ncbi:hypothetical protein DPMN_185695 [Dreissena polymorpha]|uniref:Uncharacterized protein n=1 Tax=Dreissena polymorpha TaxID=45954 RepID=A0A9D4DNA1_DREPO|nr:hypothetical protein DPMN_185695 [Dreissena polymorpha]
MAASRVILTLVVAIVLTTDGREELVKSTVYMATKMSMTGQNVFVTGIGPVHIVTKLNARMDAGTLTLTCVCATSDGTVATAIIQPQQLQHELRQQHQKQQQLLRRPPCQPLQQPQQLQHELRQQHQKQQQLLRRPPCQPLQQSLRVRKSTVRVRLHIAMQRRVTQRRKGLTKPSCCTTAIRFRLTQALGTLVNR